MHSGFLTPYINYIGLYDMTTDTLNRSNIKFKFDYWHDSTLYINGISTGIYLLIEDPFEYIISYTNPYKKIKVVLSAQKVSDNCFIIYSYINKNKYNKKEYIFKQPKPQCITDF